LDNWFPIRFLDFLNDCASYGPLESADSAIRFRT
jgi:hypothetical protein